MLLSLHAPASYMHLEDVPYRDHATHPGSRLLGASETISNFDALGFDSQPEVGVGQGRDGICLVEGCINSGLCWTSRAGGCDVSSDCSSIRRLRKAVLAVVRFMVLLLMFHVI